MASIEKHEVAKRNGGVLCASQLDKKSGEHYVIHAFHRWRLTCPGLFYWTYNDFLCIQIDYLVQRWFYLCAIPTCSCFNLVMVLRMSFQDNVQLYTMRLILKTIETIVLRKFYPNFYPNSLNFYLFGSLKESGVGIIMCEVSKGSGKN